MDLYFYDVVRLIAPVTNRGFSNADLFGNVVYLIASYLSLTPNLDIWNGPRFWRADLLVSKLVGLIRSEPSNCRQTSLSWVDIR